MSYQLYRNTTLGNTLQEALDELMQMKLLNDDIALKVLKQFDSSVNAALSGRVKTKLNFKADKLDTYRQVITQLLVVFLSKLFAPDVRLLTLVVVKFRHLFLFSSNNKL